MGIRVKRENSEYFGSKTSLNLVGAGIEKFQLHTEHGISRNYHIEKKKRKHLGQELCLVDILGPVVYIFCSLFFSVEKFQKVTQKGDFIRKDGTYRGIFLEKRHRKVAFNKSILFIILF